MIVCENCKAEHNGIYGSGRFCSKTCSRSFQLKRISQWRKNHKKPCPTCGELIYPESKNCNKCRLAWSLGDVTLAEAIYTKHHKSSDFALVRSRARAVIHKLGWNFCWVCRYDKHVDAAHLKDIASFPLDTKISVVNTPTNLAALCRNHHWEYDHNLLEKELVPPAGIEPASMA